MIVADAGGSTFRNEAMRGLSCTTGELDPFGQPVTVDLRTSKGERLTIEEHPIVRALRSGEETHGRELVVCVGGVDVPVLVGGAPVRDGRSGEIVGAVATFQDISALKHLERMREEWISVIGHDLRQPLNAIDLHAQLLARQLAREPLDLAAAVGGAEKIRAASKRLERMIQDLTDVSRIEARRLALEQRDADLGPVVRDVAARSGAAQLIRVAERGTPRLVHVDTERVEQVLENLLTNAVKYGTPGAPLDVTIVWRDEDVEVTVTNRGGGIAPEDRERVFHRFERTRGARGKKGLGLGLYICRGLVAAHGGRIWVDGTADLTSFHFTLPVTIRARASGIEGLAQPTADDRD